MKFRINAGNYEGVIFSKESFGYAGEINQSLQRSIFGDDPLTMDITINHEPPKHKNYVEVEIAELDTGELHEVTLQSGHKISVNLLEQSYINFYKPDGSMIDVDTVFADQFMQIMYDLTNEGSFECNFDEAWYYYISYEVIK